MEIVTNYEIIKLRDFSFFDRKRYSGRLVVNPNSERAALIPMMKQAANDVLNIHSSAKIINLSLIPHESCAGEGEMGAVQFSLDGKDWGGDNDAPMWSGRIPKEEYWPIDPKLQPILVELFITDGDIEEIEKEIIQKTGISHEEFLSVLKPAVMLDSMEEWSEKG